LGFAPEGSSPSVLGVRYEAITLLHAKDIEKWSDRFREQSLRDREETSLRRLEAERPFRQAIKDDIRARNSTLDPWNRAINESLIASMDHFYDSAVEARKRVEVCIAAEKYDATKSAAEVTLENPRILGTN
jgi:hypothetical protein